MIETLEIKIKGHKYQISKGATLEEIANQFQKDYRYPILLAKVNNILKELTHEIPDQADIEFIDLTSKEGNRTHISGITYILIYAVKKPTTTIIIPEIKEALSWSLNLTALYK